MKYLYWVSAVAVLVLGVFLSMNFSSQQETQSKINFSQVSIPEDFGKSVFTQLRQEIKDSPVIFLGVTPNQIEDMELWRGFLEANQEVGFKYDMVIVEPMLPYVELFASNMRIDIKTEMGRFVEGVQNARAQGLRVAVIVPNIYSSQLLIKNPVNRVQTEYKIDVMSLSVAKFPLTRQQEEAFEPRCVVGQGKDVEGTSPLGCMIQKVARRTYRQKFEENKFSGLVEQTGPKDYLILFNRNPSPR